MQAADERRHPTCDERIADELASREEQVRQLLDIIQADEPGEIDGEELTPDEAYDRLQEMPIGISVRAVIRVELSYGGPQDFIEWEPDEGTAPRYHFLDWWDGARTHIPAGSPLIDALESYWVPDVDELIGSAICGPR